MRIQHNIMAMNAYRNYSNNTSALSKNLEKLSSGYRINRAGDDAAGLAISEKMRAQITALGAAQKNVKDGISLVKTAEGATQEIHDMLNRMVDLATQSANGTYQDEVDRDAIQEEYEALKTEVNRIADASNFNGIKLLDGKLGLNTDAFTFGTAEGTAAKAATGMIKTEMPDDGTTKATDTILHESGVEGKFGEFTVDLSQLVATPGAGQKASVNITIQGVGTAINVEAAANDTVLSGKDIATALAAKANGTAGYLVVESTGAAVKNTGFEKGALAYQATDNGDGTVTFKLAGYAAAAGNTITALADGDESKLADIPDANFVHLGTAVTAAAKDTNTTLTGAENIAATNVVDTVKPGETIFGNTFLTIDAEKVKEGMTITIAGEEHTFGDDDIKISDLDLTDADGQKELTERITQAFKDNEHVSVGADTATAGKLTLAEKTDGQGKSLASEEMQKKMSTLAGFKSLVSFGEGAKSAGTTIKLADASKLSKGDVLTINDGKTEKSYSYDKDFTDMASLKTAMENDGYKVELDGDTLTVRASAADGLAPSVLGKGLTLQIGEDSQTYNQLSVAIADMHADALGVGDLDLNSQTGAQAAVDVIKNAINMVSTTRGRLGATQNRLEHTANNLSTMKENIQDAEATIRDTDIAEEMMAYTKNNILVQSAQAMLAQANQIPQGVLQLLG